VKVARKRKTRTALAALAIAGVALLAACSTGSGSTAGYTAENTDSGAIATHYNTVQPPYSPTGNSVYRENLNDAEAGQVLGLNTTSFFFQQGMSTPFFWCPSRGGAVPNTAQLTDPDFVEPDPNTNNNNHQSIIISNMDPDGVYPPAASQGTYVSCYDSAGRVFQVYSEPDVVQISAPATWSYTADNGHGGIVVTGAPVMPVCTAQYETVNGKQALETVCTAPSGGTTPVAGATTSTTPK
jgi:hypothetical protein